MDTCGNYPGWPKVADPLIEAGETKEYVKEDAWVAQRALA
jgi:hypothetical protein